MLNRTMRAQCSRENYLRCAMIVRLEIQRHMIVPSNKSASSLKTSRPTKTIKQERLKSQNTTTKYVACATSLKAVGKIGLSERARNARNEYKIVFYIQINSWGIRRWGTGGINVQPHAMRLRRILATLKPFVADKHVESTKWTSHIYDSPRNNAMAWRGPDDLIEIHFHTSCIENCRTNDMLAYVAAHEISHVLLRHGELQAHLPKICQEAEDLRMKHEHEADYLGLMLMATAGFDPKGALKRHIFMKERHDRYDRIHKKTILPGKGTHPPDDERIARIEAAMPEAYRAKNEDAPLRAYIAKERALHHEMKKAGKKMKTDSPSTIAPVVENSQPDINTATATSANLMERESILAKSARALINILRA